MKTFEVTIMDSERFVSIVHMTALDATALEMRLALMLGPQGFMMREVVGCRVNKIEEYVPVED